MASASDVPFIAQPGALPHPNQSQNQNQSQSQPESGSSAATRKRRQYRSCDACRHGRRACDADFALAPPEVVRACSNCLRKGKQCTFDWLQKLPGQHRYRYDGALVSGQNVQSDDVDESASQEFQLSDHTSSNAMPEDASTAASRAMFEAYAKPHDEYSRIADQTYGRPADSTAASTVSTIFSNAVGNQASPLDTSTSQSSPAKKKRRTRTGKSEAWHDVRKRRASGLKPAGASRGLNDQLSLATNKSMIAGSLIKIYSDSFEHLLSCWVEKYTCPYYVSSYAPKQILRHQDFDTYKPQLRFHELVCGLDSKLGPLAGSFNGAESLNSKRALQKAIMAFASQWSARNQSNGREQSMRQGSAGGNSEYGLPSHDMFDADEDSSSFDRILQQSLWHEAQKTVMATSQTASFCAIFAHLVFAFTQPPMAASANSNTRSSRLDTYTNNRHFSADATSSTQSSSAPIAGDEFKHVPEVKGAEKPPIFLEVALRHLNAWRRTVSRLEMQAVDDQSQTSPLGSNARSLASRSTVTKKDVDDFSLVFWFGIMCDTTSAAITNRPVIISDEDCVAPPSLLDQFDETKGQYDTGSMTENTDAPEDGSIWRLEHFQQGMFGPSNNNNNIRWPCSLADAATVLRDGTQIKVLLYRRVTVLQSLVYRRVSTATIEKAIHESLQVQQSFDATYGRFIQDCIRDHENIPARFQSWYIILGIHWNMGMFLLTDAIEDIDAVRKTGSLQRELRGHSALVSNIRLSTARASAELAKASCSSTNILTNHAMDRDFSFSEGAFLTEPWADLLVRALVRSATVFLSLLTNPADERTPSSSPGDQDEYSTPAFYQYVHDCISGLRQLARKSEVAGIIAKELRDRLDQVIDLDASPDGDDSSGPDNQFSMPHNGVGLLDRSLMGMNALDGLATTQAGNADMLLGMNMAGAAHMPLSGDVLHMWETFGQSGDNNNNGALYM